LQPALQPAAAAIAQDLLEIEWVPARPGNLAGQVRGSLAVARPWDAMSRLS